MTDLELFIKAYDAYENGNPIISDEEWDNLYFKLGEQAQILRYEVKNELKKVKHNHPMLSLDKTKDWNEFLRYFNDKDVIGMVKLDGLTCSLRYLNGILISAETRGNGEEGEDILHNAQVIKSIPKIIDYKDELIIDGEVICKYNDFEPWSEEYKNPRNFAAGSIRLLDSKECEKRNLTFYAWNVVKGFEDTNCFLNKINKLEELGFLVVPWTSSFDWDAKEFLIESARKENLPCDGLVGRFDDIAYGESLGSTGHHIKAAYAFKFYDELYDTELKDIEWTMGRSGILTPVAIFNPVEIDGSIVERASLHNVSIMKETLGENIYAGQPIKIFKSNMIIPQVFKSISKFDDNNIDLQAKLSFYPEEGTIFNLTTHYFLEIPKVCPICGGETKLVVSESGTVQLICKNENCSGKIINKLDHFCGKKGLNIKGLSKATLEKLLDWEWISSIKDLFNLESKRDEWILKDGFGYKSVDNILTAIENAKKCNLESYLCAIGIPLVGEHISKLIINKFNTWDSFRKAVDNNYEFYNIQGIGIEIHNSILSFDYSEFDIIANLLNFEEIIENNEKQILKDKIFVITGSLNNYKNRSELQKEIEKYGGKVSSSISKKTSYLINNDINSTSSKNISAKKLGVPIITEENFKNFLTN